MNLKRIDVARFFVLVVTGRKLIFLYHNFIFSDSDKCNFCFPFFLLFTALFKRQWTTDMNLLTLIFYSVDHKQSSANMFQNPKVSTAA